MNPSSGTRERRAPRRQHKALNQIAPVSRRRLARNLPKPTNSDQLQSLTSQQTNLRPSQPTTTLHTPQTSLCSARKRRAVDACDKQPLKRAKLTATNLEKLEMGGRERKSAAKKSSGGSSTTTTTDKNFGAKLQQNGIVYRTWEAKDAVDVAQIRERLDQPRASEPPNESVYKRYRRVTEEYDNELSVEYSAYPLLSKRDGKAELSGYLPRLNHPWSAVDNKLTKGLSDAQPDLAESYCATDYPSQAVEALSGNLAPSLYNEAMATYAVEFKSSSGDMKEATLQCAYNGALMTLSAEAVHAHMQKSSNDFYSKTQAVTVATNGAHIDIYGHQALQVPAKVGPLARVAARDRGDADTVAAAGNCGDSAGAVATVEYHQYCITSDHPRESFEAFKKAYKHVRNAQELGYELASERKDALWAYSESADVHSNVPITPPESSNNHPVSPQETPQAKPRRTRQKAADSSSVVVDKPRVRRNAKTSKKNIVVE